MASDSSLWHQHHITVSGEASALVDALVRALPALSRRRAREAVLSGLVRVQGAQVIDPKSLVEPGNQVDLDLAHGIPHHQARAAGSTPDRSAPPFTVLYEDDEVVVLDKAAGILSAPGGEEEGRDNVLGRLRLFWRRQGREVPFLGVVHRIDLATSGCLVVARTRHAQHILQAQFSGEGAGRTYTALVVGNPRRDQDTLTGTIGRGEDGRRALVADPTLGKSAITHFRVVERFAQAAHLELNLGTGRTHQIRIHTAAIGCPVLGDPVYSRELRKNKRVAAGSTLGIRVPRLMLHAHGVAFDHPRHGRRIEVKAPLPEIFTTVCATLRRAKPATPGASAPTPRKPARKPLR